MEVGGELASKKFNYFVSLSSNVPYVLKDTLKMVENQNEVSIQFDLDSARVLDGRYLKKMERTTGTNLSSLINSAVRINVALLNLEKIIPYANE